MQGKEGRATKNVSVAAALLHYCCDRDSDRGWEVLEPEPEPLSAEQQAREAALGRAGAYREAGNEAFKRCVWAGGGRTERHSRTH